jgi:diguanylate cyclase (GGDEF)-like protein
MPLEDYSLGQQAYCGKVLIIDDHAADLELIARQVRRLKTLSLEPVCVISVDDAFEALQKHSFKLCICDYWLHDRTGLDFITSLNEAGLSLPVLVSTSGISLEIDESIMRAGAADSIGKHEINSPIFERTLRHVLIRQNAMMQLIDEASLDPLTQCLSRRYFERKAKYDLACATRKQQNLCALIIDLDKLKDINDNHGHEGGDITLSIVSRHLREALRENDYIGRIGGDEFAVILPACSAAEGAEVAQRLIDATGEIKLAFDQQTLRPTISIGVADNSSSHNPKGLLRAADGALYEAKKYSGSHYCIASSCSTWSDQIANQ